MNMMMNQVMTTLSQLVEVVRRISIRGDPRMTIKAEISYVVVQKDTYHILLSIHILRQSTMESHHRAQISHSFRPEEGEAVQGR
jgi:predicted NUDIX family phosphoesterase